VAFRRLRLFFLSFSDPGQPLFFFFPALARFWQPQSFFSFPPLKPYFTYPGGNTQKDIFCQTPPPSTPSHHQDVRALFAVLTSLAVFFSAALAFFSFFFFPLWFSLSVFPPTTNLERFFLFPRSPLQKGPGLLLSPLLCPFFSGRRIFSAQERVPCRNAGPLSLLLPQLFPLRRWFGFFFFGRTFFLPPTSFFSFLNTCFSPTLGRPSLARHVRLFFSTFSFFAQPFR